MKKLCFLFLLSAIAVKLKAQQKPTGKPLGSFYFKPELGRLDTTVLKLSFKQNSGVQNQSNAKSADNLYAALDHMPIIKPNGNWKMPFARPDASTSYTMPIKKLPPVIQKTVNNPKLNP